MCSALFSASKTLAKTLSPDNEKVEKGYLKSSVLLKWSPAQAGQVGNQKKLDDFVNLLNLNPDRYVSAVVSTGDEPDAFALVFVPHGLDIDRLSDYDIISYAFSRIVHCT